MADRFIGLHEFVAKAAEPEHHVVETAVAAPQIEVGPEFAEAAAEARRFRAAVRDAVDVAVSTVLRDIVTDVLARELELAPVKLHTIVARACARYASEGIVRVRVHPDEAAQVASPDVEIVGDSELRRGDALLEVRSGTIDVTLGARLADVLERSAS